MSENNMFMARKLQRQIPAAETRIDDALIAVSSLMTTIVTARRDTGDVRPAKGQATIHRLAKAQLALMDASGGVLRVHGDLAGIARESAGLDPHECPAIARADTVQRGTLAS